MDEQKKLHEEEKALLIKKTESASAGEAGPATPTKVPREIVSPFTTQHDQEGTSSPDHLRQSLISPDKFANGTHTSGFGGGSRGTMTNFHFKQDKQKMDAAAERLIHSVNAVTDLLKANTNLRDNIERVQRDLEEKDAESF